MYKPYIGARIGIRLSFRIFFAAAAALSAGVGVGGSPFAFDSVSECHMQGKLIRKELAPL